MKLVLLEDNGATISIIADDDDLKRAAKDSLKLSELVTLVAGACVTAVSTSDDPFSKRRESLG